ncbi:MAG TPA: tetratricopeptide repeat protein [Acidisarcina sp.]
MPVAKSCGVAALLLFNLAVLAQESAPFLDVDRDAALMTAGNAEAARDAFEAALSSDPGNQRAQDGEVAASERLALDRRAAGDKDGALRDLLRARDFAPHSGRLLYDLGVLEDEMLLFKDADKTLNAAEEFLPGDTRLLYAWARVKLDLGQLGPAEEKMKAYLKQRPDDATAHFGLGRIYQLSLRFDEARLEFNKSIELHPLQTEAYYQLGDMALQQGELEEAAGNFEKTLSRNPKHGGALAEMGEIYFKQKKYEKAVAFLTAAISAAPDYQPGHYFLGLALGRLGQAEESHRELDIATRLADAEHGKAAHGRQLDDAVPGR